MNEYTFEQIQIAQEAHFERTVTATMMDAFREISGDVNPLHGSDDYARALGFPGRVVYGMLISSLYSALAGVYLPGKYCLLYGVDSKFRKPVYIGDTLTVSGTVTEKNDTFRLVIVKAHIINQKGEKISKATLEIGFVTKKEYV